MRDREKLFVLLQSPLASSRYTRLMAGSLRDQIGSTRIVTDDTGGVVYAAAHDPYGGIQKNLESELRPNLD